MRRPSFWIRPAEAADARRLSRLGPATFCETFGGQFRTEDIDARMAEVYAPARLRADLADPAQSWFLALAGARAVGFLTLNASDPPSCVRGPRPLELARIYVRAAWHGHGPGRALMEAGLAEARARGARTLWLRAWARNPRALAFYRAHGFQEVGQIAVAFGGRRLPHLLMARRLDRP